MKNSRESSSQIILFILQYVISPLIFAGGATGILALFKESLPNSLYIAFLYIIWVVIALMLIWLVSRLLFGDWVKTLRQWTRKKSTERLSQKIASEWHEKWKELVVLLLEILPHRAWTKEQPGRYDALHSWFNSNRTHFLPIWDDFIFHRTKTAYNENYDSVVSLAYKVFRDNEKDPFSYFYAPLFLPNLIITLRVHKDTEIAEVLVKLRELTDELMTWIQRKK